jgi:hypothetical protein
MLHAIRLVAAVLRKPPVSTVSAINATTAPATIPATPAFPGGLGRESLGWLFVNEAGRRRRHTRPTRCGERGVP